MIVIGWLLFFVNKSERQNVSHHISIMKEKLHGKIQGKNA